MNTHTHMTHSNNIPTSGIINVTTNDQNTSCSNNKTTSSSNNKLYKGVRKRKWGKWVSEIRLPNSRERIWLGSYDTQEKAARAFDAALYCLRGCHASFNFPNTPLTINNVSSSVGDHKSLSPQEIQEIAAKFANEYSPPPNELSSTQEQDQLVVVPLESQHRSDNSNSNSYSCPLYDNNDESVQLDYGDMKRMDWRFEDMLDDNMNNGVANCSDFGPYYGLDDKMQYSTQVFEEHNVDQIEYEDEDVFSNHPFLWSWNF